MPKSTAEKPKARAPSNIMARLQEAGIDRLLPLGKRPRKRAHPEFDLHCAVADYLRAVLHPRVLWFHIPNERRASPKQGAQLKRMGVLAGVPDFVLTWIDAMDGDPRCLYLELKAKGGKLSAAQIEFIRRATHAGADFATASTIQVVEKVLTDAEVPLRARIAA